MLSPLGQRSLTQFSPPSSVFADHRTIRRFLSDPIDPEHLEFIMQAGWRAPTDAQGHMFSVLRITESGLRDRLAQLCGDQRQIREAGEFFVLCLDVHRLKLLVEHRGGEFGMKARIALLYGAVDTTLVAQNMVIAAEMLGYGICYIGAVQNNTDKIARLLKLPQLVLPLFGLCVGVPDPAKVPDLRPRLPIVLSFHENEYPSDFSAEQLEGGYEAMKRDYDWFAKVEKYFATGGTMDKREDIMNAAWLQQGFAPK